MKLGDKLCKTSRVGVGAAALKRGHIDCRIGKEKTWRVWARGALQGPLALKTKIKTKSCTVLLTNNGHLEALKWLGSEGWGWQHKDKQGCERERLRQTPQASGTSMRYGAGDLSGGRAPWDGPSPLSSPLARVAGHSRDTTENG